MQIHSCLLGFNYQINIRNSICLVIMWCDFFQISESEERIKSEPLEYGAVTYTIEQPVQHKKTIICSSNNNTSATSRCYTLQQPNAAQTILTILPPTPPHPNSISVANSKVRDSSVVISQYAYNCSQLEYYFIRNIGYLGKVSLIDTFLILIDTCRKSNLILDLYPPIYGTCILEDINMKYQLGILYYGYFPIHQFLNSSKVHQTIVRDTSSF